MSKPNSRHGVLKPIQRLEEIPPFASEAEEAEFWSTHSFGEALLEQMKPLPQDVLPPRREHQLEPTPTHRNA